MSMYVQHFGVYVYVVATFSSYVWGWVELTGWLNYTDIYKLSNPALIRMSLVLLYFWRKFTFISKLEETKSSSCE